VSPLPLPAPPLFSHSHTPPFLTLSAFTCTLTCLLSLCCPHPLLQPPPHLMQSPCRTLPCSTPPQVEKPTACLAEGITADGDQHYDLQPDQSQPWWHGDQPSFGCGSRYPKEVPEASVMVARTARAACTLPCRRGLWRAVPSQDALKRVGSALFMGQHDPDPPHVLL